MAETMLFQSKASVGGTVLEFVSIGIKETRELVLDNEGIRGTRSKTLERAAQGLIHIAGPLEMNPTPLELKTIWPYVVQNSTGYTLTDAMQDVTLVKDFGTTANISESYSGRFSKATLSGRPGEKLKLVLDFIGYSTTISTGGTLSSSADITNRPYMMQDMGSGITIGSNTISVEEFELVIDQKIVPTFLQGQTATDLMPDVRDVTLSIRPKYSNSTETGLLTTAQAGPVLGSPVTGSLAFTDGTNSVTFAFNALIAQAESPTLTSRKIRMPLTYHALRVGTNLEVVTSFT